MFQLLRLPNSLQFHKMKRITPHERVVRHTAEICSIQIQRYILNTSAKIIVNYLDIHGDYLFEDVFVIEGEEFTQWGSDDDYLYNLVAQKCGFTILSDVDTSPPPPSPTTVIEPDLGWMESG